MALSTRFSSFFIVFSSCAWYTEDSRLNEISLEYSYEELREATSNFDAAVKLGVSALWTCLCRCLGAGSYGGVFKGVLKA